MLRYLGYVAIALSLDASTNRTCRLRNATPERLRWLIDQNLRDLLRVLEFNLQHDIFLYRISSQVIPFASHPVNQIPWWEEYAGLFLRLSDFIGRHHLRVSMHPGHFTVLNAPDREILAASIKEIEWHVRFMECLGTDATNKIVVHIGGAYRGKREAVDRFVGVVGDLPESWQRRLIVENDERIFSVGDVLDIAGRTGLPVVFDWLHHQANRSGEGDVTTLVRQCFDTWQAADGLPKVHFSSQAKGGRVGQHADWVDAQEFERFLRLAPAREFDCMLEAKGKERALFRLRDWLRGRDLGERATT
jgi:UV DNA damage endonuclease